MRKLLIHSILATAAGLAILPTGQAQSSRPNLSGIWSRSDNTQNFSAAVPPLQAAFKATYDENRRGVTLPAGGLDELDPTIYCLAHGTPRAMAANAPFEIVQGPGQVIYVLFEQSQLQRRIYMDGRRLPDNYPATFMGFSTGRYDGDALVVETVSLNDKTWLDNSGIPHSDALRVTERMRRTGQNTMEIAFRFEDAKAFTRPWDATKPYELKPDWEIMENTGYCEDRFLHNYSQKLFKGTVDWQSPEQATGR
jgi:hypothetical protein